MTTFLWKYWVCWRNLPRFLCRRISVVTISLSVVTWKDRYCVNNCSFNYLYVQYVGFFGFNWFSMSAELKVHLCECLLPNKYVIWCRKKHTSINFILQTWCFPSALGMGGLVFMSSQRMHIQMIRSCIATLCSEAMLVVRYSQEVLKVGRGHGYGQTVWKSRFTTTVGDAGPRRSMPLRWLSHLRDLLSMWGSERRGWS